MSSNRPSTPGGAKMRWRIAGVSCTLPSKAPDWIWAPAARSGAVLETPQARMVERRNVHPARNEVASLLGVFEQGRCTPSKMPPSRPGPSSTDSGCPRAVTGSPGRSDSVGSYTCTRARAPWRLMTSPLKFMVPTLTSSPVRTSASSMVTSGPLISMILPTDDLAGLGRQPFGDRALQRLSQSFRASFESVVETNIPVAADDHHAAGAVQGLRRQDQAFVQRRLRGAPRPFVLQKSLVACVDVGDEFVALNSRRALAQVFDQQG